MKTRTPLIRAAIAVAIAGCIFALMHGSPAIPAQQSVSMAVDATAPLHATLLPMVSVYADATEPDSVVAMRIAATQALPVTLLPTVHVTLRMSELAAAVPRTMRAVATTERALAAVIATQAIADYGQAPASAEAAGDAPRLRTQMMPR